MKDFFVSHFWCRNRFFLLHGQESLNGQILTLFRLRNLEILLFPCKKCVVTWCFYRFLPAIPAASEQGLVCPCLLCVASRIASVSIASIASIAMEMLPKRMTHRATRRNQTETEIMNEEQSCVIAVICKCVTAVMCKKLCAMFIIEATLHNTDHGT